MAADPRMMRLGLSLAANGTHKGGWRHPAAADGVALDIAVWRQMAQAAERAKVHFIFLADGAAVRTEAENDEMLSFNGRIDQFEPLTLLSALASSTEHIGLVATASTTYSEPYSVARKYASLDYLSGGRAGWNVVTSWSEAEALNFSRDHHLEHDERYRRAEEFVDVVRGLWDSWEDDAFLRDKASGRYFNPAKLHTLNHKGEFFKVRGPLNIARPPQGYPVIAQAGGSEPGQRLAARTADLVYTAIQELPKARQFRDGLRARVAQAGRSPDDVKVMPGMLPIIGSTQAEAAAKLAELQALIDPRIGLSLLRVDFGDLSGYDLDGPLPELGETNQTRSMREMWVERARRENLTIRQLYQLIAVTSGHCLMVGTPESIADEMQRWFEADGCDGFNIMAPYMPGGLLEFLDHVVPVLQKRGVFHTEYEGTTLRENLGLPRPENAYLATAARK
jgi:N-acetyl-S-(2-succino)cysteine monooxygenase